MANVTVLGAGPAGVGAAYWLARSGRASVLALERQAQVGGNSGSFVLDGVHCDYGSHRLHPASEPHVLEAIQEALGQDLLWRPRHGRIRLQGRWIHFPLQPVDLLSRLPMRFAAALLRDALGKPLRRMPPGEASFASVLRHGLGRTLSESFYFPYVTKLWALPPEELAVTLARRRVSGNSLSRIAMKIVRQVPGFRGPRTGGFYYPRTGFGAISAALRTRAEASGAHFAMNAQVRAIEHHDGHVRAVRWEADGTLHRRESAAVWSTIPITALVRLAEPAAPAAVLAAAERIRFRGMILVYLVLEQDRFTEYDAHYFPEASVPIARLSEPKNYSAAREPAGVTVLCAELPSDPGDAWWTLGDAELGTMLCGWLGSVGLPVRATVRRTVTRRLAYAYPVYDRAFEPALATLDHWVGSIDGLLTFGRQGLFAHDNTHHALAMAHAAVDCLGADGRFDAERWQAYRRVFETHVVED
ncbi:MAG: FAD-dependent oxidoreductase [Casimicrobiaceae bacterium]